MGKTGNPGAACEAAAEGKRLSLTGMPNNTRRPRPVQALNAADLIVTSPELGAPVFFLQLDPFRAIGAVALLLLHDMRGEARP